ALEAMGLRRGDRAAILSENRPEWAIADYASLAIGVRDVPVYHTLPANQIAYILTDAGVRAVFASTREQLDKILEIRDELPTLERIVVFDDVEPPDEGVVRYDDLLARGRAEDEAGRGDDFRARALAAAEPDDVATILYTSGTT